VQRKASVRKEHGRSEVFEMSKGGAEKRILEKGAKVKREVGVLLLRKGCLGGRLVIF